MASLEMRGSRLDFLQKKGRFPSSPLQAPSTIKASQHNHKVSRLSSIRSCSSSSSSIQLLSIASTGKVIILFLFPPPSPSPSLGISLIYFGALVAPCALYWISAQQFQYWHSWSVLSLSVSLNPANRLAETRHNTKLIIPFLFLLLHISILLFLILYLSKVLHSNFFLLFPNSIAHI